MVSESLKPAFPGTGAHPFARPFASMQLAIDAQARRVVGGKVPTCWRPDNPRSLWSVTARRHWAEGTAGACRGTVISSGDKLTCFALEINVIGGTYYPFRVTSVSGISDPIGPTL
jgi:hypothetical protein